MPNGRRLCGDRRCAEFGRHPKPVGCDRRCPNAATNCKILGAAIPASEVTVNHGSYHYDSSAQKFTPQIPAVAPDNYNLTQVTITHTVNTTFARVLGTIVEHRHRDVHRRTSAPRHRHRLGLLRVDEQRKRSVEQRNVLGIGQ